VNGSKLRSRSLAWYPRAFFKLARLPGQSRSVTTPAAAQPEVAAAAGGPGPGPGHGFAAARPAAREAAEQLGCHAGGRGRGPGLAHEQRLSLTVRLQ
jgi:hypothetical protein